MNKNTPLNDFANNIEKFSYNLTSTSDEELLFRPLIHSDVRHLADFLENLSSETRRLSTFDTYDRAMAQELCDAINKYDKLRYVLVNNNQEIVGLIEFTLDIPQDDVERYLSYGINLNLTETCRFGPTLADSYQSQGIGRLLFPYIIKIVRLIGKSSVILYGGVLADNERAIKYYLKQGFIEAGRFINSDGNEAVDMILDLNNSMDINLSKLNYSFKHKPLLVGGKAKEYYQVRKSGEDTDLIVSTEDYEALSKMYPNNLKDLWGDLGVVVYEFEVWKTICQFDYEYLSDGAIEIEDYKIISLEKLLFLTALAIKKQKYLDDLYLIVDKVLNLKYKDFDDSKYRTDGLTK